jgi:hypothetical protein
MAMKISTDIDIDFVNRDDILRFIKHIPATTRQENVLKKHNSGVYFNPIPHDPLTGFAAIDFREAEDRGYFKIDFLNNSLYTGIQNEEHLDRLIAIEPLWELLEEKDVVSQLAHIHNHYDTVSLLKPKSIEQLAAVLAVIRPAKKYLIRQGWQQIMNEVWIKPDDETGYYFKKSHAISYATAVVVQLNLICEQAVLSAASHASV